MNFLKRLFSRKNKAPENQNAMSSDPASLHDLVMNHAEPAQVLGSIRIPDHADVPVYPFFAHRDFEGNIPNNLVGGFHHKQGEEMPEVVVNLVAIQGEDLMIVDSVDMEENLFGALYDRAFKNLEELDEIEYKLLADYDNKLALASSHEFTSETILSQKHMLRLHKLLGSNDILVSVVRRGFLLACSKNESEKVKNTFVNYSMYVRKMPVETELLTTDIFGLRNGTVQGFIPVGIQKDQ